MRPQKGKLKIFESAMALFEEQGYFATTVEQITNRAGVSKGLVYNYFPSKECLLVGLLEFATEKMQVQAEALTDEGTISESLGRFVDGYFSFLANEKRFLKLQLTLMLMPELSDVVREPIGQRAERLLKGVTKWLERRNVTKPKQKARLFIALLDGIALHYLSIFERYPLMSLKKLTQESLNSLIVAENQRCVP